MVNIAGTVHDQYIALYIPAFIFIGIIKYFRVYVDGYGAYFFVGPDKIIVIKVDEIDDACRCVGTVIPLDIQKCEDVVYYFKPVFGIACNLLQDFLLIFGLGIDKVFDHAGGDEVGCKSKTGNDDKAIGDQNFQEEFVFEHFFIQSPLRSPLYRFRSLRPEGKSLYLTIPLYGDLNRIILSHSPAASRRTVHFKAL